MLVTDIMLAFVSTDLMREKGIASTHIAHNVEVASCVGIPAPPEDAGDGVVA